MQQVGIAERFSSKKNQVFRTRRELTKEELLTGLQSNGRHTDTVTKVFADTACFRMEKGIGDLLIGTDLPTPRRISVDENSLSIVYEYVDAPPAVDFIETANLKQAKEMIDKICDWLIRFYRICQQKTGQQYIWGDIHLRNLLYQVETGTIYGVDFEECRLGRLETDAARICVFLLHYDPAFTVRKKALSVHLQEILSARLKLEQDFLEHEILRETEELLVRRAARI